MITLRQAIGAHFYRRGRNEPLMIEYRTMFEDGIDFISILGGACKYFEGKLETLDGDTYSLDDRICAYESCEDRLIVYYESEWIGR